MVNKGMSERATSMTLIEVLAVVLIASLVVATVVAATPSWNAQADLRTATRRIASALDLTSLQADLQGVPWRLRGLRNRIIREVMLPEPEWAWRLKASFHLNDTVECRMTTDVEDPAAAASEEGWMVEIQPGQSEDVFGLLCDHESGLAVRADVVPMLGVVAERFIEGTE